MFGPFFQGFKNVLLDFKTGRLFASMLVIEATLPPPSTEDLLRDHFLGTQVLSPDNAGM